MAVASPWWWTRSAAWPARTSRAADDIRQMGERLQGDTQQAVSFTQEGVQDVDNRLRLAEDAPSGNVHLYQAVERTLIAPIFVPAGTTESRLMGCPLRRPARRAASAHADPSLCVVVNASPAMGESPPQPCLQFASRT